MGNDFGKVLLGAIAGLGAYLCGLNWQLIIIWILLVIIDIATGVIKAARQGKFSSHDMKIGLLKKVGEFLLMFALLLIQNVAIINKINIPVASIFIATFCFKEFGSILENNIEMGVKIPSIVSNWFKSANSTINQYKEEKEGNK